MYKINHRKVETIKPGLLCGKCATHWKHQRTRILVLLNKGIRCKTGTRWDAHCAVSMKFVPFLRKQVIGET